ncbi:MAG: hypothetical protein HRU15_17940, partial [Planctomycetes bacterium]|nr:hypothetical protein [Planctomycetota bacterium]
MLRYLCLLICVLSIILSIHAESYSLTPKSRFDISFPDLPQTLAKADSVLKVFLPENYSSDKEYPLFVWFGGGAGGTGGNPGLVDYKHFISIGLPLYKVNMSEKVLLKPNDVEFAWQHYQIMLEKLFEVVPNIQRYGGLAGGFSNGGHNVGMLLNCTDNIFTTYFESYLFWEGGYIITDSKIFKGKAALFIMGDQSPCMKFLPPKAAAAENAGGLIQSIVMEN